LALFGVTGYAILVVPFWLYPSKYIYFDAEIRVPATAAAMADYTQFQHYDHQKHEWRNEWANRIAGAAGAAGAAAAAATL
jgi:hypothetical protein